MFGVGFSVSHFFVADGSGSAGPYHADHSCGDHHNAFYKIAGFQILLNNALIDQKTGSAENHDGIQDVRKCFFHMRHLLKLPLLAQRENCNHLPGLKESFRLTERLNTRCSAEESRLSGQK